MSLGLIHLALSALVGWGPAEFHDPLYGEKLDQLRSHLARAPKGTPLVLVLGSSRALTGLNARRLEQRLAETRRRPVVVYNFAVPGGGPVTELLLLRRLLDAGIRPDTLILETSPTFFAEVAVPDNLTWLESHGIGLGERNWLESYGPLADPRSVTTTSGVLVPWYRHRFALVRWVARGFMPSIPWGVLSSWFDEHGWEPIGGDRRSDQMYAQFVAAERGALGPYFQNSRLAPASRRVFQDLLTLLDSQQIRTVLALFPEGSDLRRWCPAEFRARVMAALGSVGREREVTIVDGHDWLSDDDFFDPIHLIASGADRFTDRLAGLTAFSDIRAPLAFRRR
ncbi:MAG TPA: DUF1574 family protein [Pirellulales bacterium]|nr:DUF1574 family protein [Pirellulales bacterium]